MKNFWKILAALMVVALPFVVASCGGDDDEDQIPTYTYTWDLNGIDINKVSEDQQVPVINARNAVNQQIGAAYKAKGFTVDTENKKFTIQTETAVKTIDERVEETFLELKRTTAFQAQASVLPASATILIKRGSTTVINNRSLSNN